MRLHARLPLPAFLRGMKLSACRVAGLPRAQPDRPAAADRRRTRRRPPMLRVAKPPPQPVQTKRERQKKRAWRRSWPGKQLTGALSTCQQTRLRAWPRAKAGAQQAAHCINAQPADKQVRACSAERLSMFAMTACHCQEHSRLSLLAGCKATWLMAPTRA